MTIDYRRLWSITAVFCALAVFLVDLRTPNGVAEWVLYLPLVLIIVLFYTPRYLIGMSVLCSLLLVTGFFHSPGEIPFWIALSNRCLGLVAMWLMAFAGILICRRSSQVAKGMSNLEREIAEHRRTKDELQRNEERLRLAMHGAGMGTWDEDFRSQRMVWSDSLFRTLGFPPETDGKATREMWWSVVHPEDREQLLEAWRQAERERSMYGHEYRIIRADDGATIWLADFGRFVFDLDGRPVRFLGVAFDVTQRKALERAILEVATREQEQIGQELHDSVGQELTGLGLMAQCLAQGIPDEASKEMRIALRLIAGLDHVHEGVRRLSRGLIPVHVESRGLGAALYELAATTTEQSGIIVTAESPEWVEMPEHSAAVQLFRITREAISNALRHGRPQRIRVSLLSEPNGVRLRIKDDGVGIRRRSPPSEGLGLRIMQYRAGLIGALLRIEPAEGGGTVVTCTLPRRNLNDKHSSVNRIGASHDTDRG